MNFVLYTARAIVTVAMMICQGLSACFGYAAVLLVQPQNFLTNELERRGA